jgi:hypothetical protein
MFAVHLEAHHASLEDAFAALTRPEQISGVCVCGFLEGGAVWQSSERLQGPLFFRAGGRGRLLGCCKLAVA